MHFSSSCLYTQCYPAVRTLQQTFTPIHKLQQHLYMISRTRGVVKGGRLLSASSTRSSSSQHQQLFSRGHHQGLSWRSSSSSAAEFGPTCSKKAAAKNAAAAVSVHEVRRRLSATATSRGEVAAAARLARSSSTSITAACVAAAAAAVALGSAGGGGEEKEEEEEGREQRRRGTGSTNATAAAAAAEAMPSTIAAAASSLLSRPRAVECGAQRRIQDMYHMVDSPIGQGARWRAVFCQARTNERTQAVDFCLVYCASVFIATEVRVISDAYNIIVQQYEYISQKKEQPPFFGGSDVDCGKRYRSTSEPKKRKN